MNNENQVRDVSRVYGGAVEPLTSQIVGNRLGSQARVLTALKQALQTSERFTAAVAFITQSGVASVYQALLDLTERGGTARFVASDYLNFTQPDALRKLAAIPGVEVRLIQGTSYHGKLYHFEQKKRETFIVGSSNLTQNALSVNDELNYLYSGGSNATEIKNGREQIDRLWAAATPLSKKLLDDYDRAFRKAWAQRTAANEPVVNLALFSPNELQKRALQELKRLRNAGGTRGLIVSATGTGKTVLSAFDVRQMNAKSALFLVHRSTVAKKSLSTFKSILGPVGKFGLVGAGQNDWDSDYLFSTVQTVSKPESLEKLGIHRFDYIVIDETHRAASSSYQRLIEHFQPKFLLGMTATPERTDGQDIFSVFHNNIVCDIRLKDALQEKILCPFHYYGISEIEVGGQSLDEQADITALSRPARFHHLLSASQQYGADSTPIRSLVFMSRVDEANAFVVYLTGAGHAAVALSGNSTETEKENAIGQLESGNLEYIVTVDIFNEGVDIPSVNQLLLARPTQSAIVFIQQFGRGLRTHPGKDYLTVIDIVGNYENNYLIPIALYGDRSQNKDTLRRLMRSEETFIPGPSTVSFDRVTKERIFDAIKKAPNLGIKQLKDEYSLVKAKTGRFPTLMALREHGELDPIRFSQTSSIKSLHDFAIKYDRDYTDYVNAAPFPLMGLLMNEALDGIQCFEPLILKQLITDGTVSYANLHQDCVERFGLTVSRAQFESALRVVSLEYGYSKSFAQWRVVESGHNAGQGLKDLSPQQTAQLMDAIEFALASFDDRLSIGRYCDGFIVGAKYTYKETFRILCWKKNPNPQNIGGYFLSRETNDMAIFVNYHKQEDAGETVQYEDRFVSPDCFHWTTKNSRSISSPEVVALTQQSASGLRVPLFIRKEATSEGTGRYYLGELETVLGSQKTVSVGGKSAVSMDFLLDQPVPTALYRHILGS